MHHLADESYRSLESLCRHQARLAMTPAARSELERMAREYKRMADLQDAMAGDVPNA